MSNGPLTLQELRLLSSGGGEDDLTIKWSAINATASGDTTILAAVAGKKITVVQWEFHCSAAVTIKVMSGTTGEGQTTLIEGMDFAADGGVTANALPGIVFETAAARAVVFNLSGASNVRGGFNYVERA